MLVAHYIATVCIVCTSFGQHLDTFKPTRVMMNNCRSQFHHVFSKKKKANTTSIDLFFAISKHGEIQENVGLNFIMLWNSRKIGFLFPWKNIYKFIFTCYSSPTSSEFWTFKMSHFWPKKNMPIMIPKQFLRSHYINMFWYDPSLHC